MAAEASLVREQVPRSHARRPHHTDLCGCFVLIYISTVPYSDRLVLVAQLGARLVVHPGAVRRARALRRRAAPARPALDDDARLPPRGLRVRV